MLTIARAAGHLGPPRELALWPKRRQLGESPAQHCRPKSRRSFKQPSRRENRLLDFG
jgi:hypothetical protein